MSDPNKTHQNIKNKSQNKKRGAFKRPPSKISLLERIDLTPQQQIAISYAELEEQLEQEKENRIKDNSEKDKKIGQLHVMYILVIAVIALFSFCSHSIFSLWVKVLSVGVVFIILTILAKYHNDTYSSEIFKFLAIKWCSRGDSNPRP